MPKHPINIKENEIELIDFFKIKRYRMEQKRLETIKEEVAFEQASFYEDEKGHAELKKSNPMELTDFKKANQAPQFSRLYTGLHFLDKNIAPPKPESPGGLTDCVLYQTQMTPDKQFAPYQNEKHHRDEKYTTYSKKR